jgi:hypothetical protein
VSGAFGPVVALNKSESVLIAQSLRGGEQMFPHALFNGGLATGGIDMTADFAPLLVGMWVLLSLCVLAFAVAIGMHDTRESTRQAAEQAAAESAALPKAA